MSNWNISNSNVTLGEGYYAAVDKSILRYWLLLDCTKGYNYLSWGWLSRVLTKAGLHPELLCAIRRLVEHHSAVILVFRSHTCAPLHLHSGLAQGCPLSCVLYVLAVDPFLEYVASIHDVCIVVGFCDDWSVECGSVTALYAVQEAGDEFELCSGQMFNRLKSQILPTRALTVAEQTPLLSKWPGCPIKSRAKVLGLWVGYDYKAAELGKEIEAKYCSRQSLLRSLPSSFASKIVLLNVFLRSMWSYVNRHVLLPVSLRRRIEAAVSKYLSRVPYFALIS